MSRSKKGLQISAVGPSFVILFVLIIQRSIFNTVKWGTFSYPWCQVHGISFEGFPRPWQTILTASQKRVLSFLKSWGPFPESRRPWFAVLCTSDGQTRPGSELPVSLLVWHLTLKLSKKKKNNKLMKYPILIMMLVAISNYKRKKSASTKLFTIFVEFQNF